MAFIAVERYSAMRRVLRKFASGTDPLLVVKGGPGLGKTEAVQRALRRLPHLMLRGKKSALDLYIDLFEHRDMLVVIDDVDALLAIRDGQELVRDVTETVTKKTLRWGTQSSRLVELGIPKQFQTTSRVIVITNSWSDGGVREAIASRALSIDFCPPWREVYLYAAGWFQDQEVLDFVHSNLHILSKPDLRVLLNARQLRGYSVPGVPWQSAFDGCFGVSKRRQAALRILSDASFGSNAARAREFERLGHGDRATFYRHVAELRAKVGNSTKRLIVGEKRGPGRPPKNPAAGLGSDPLVGEPISAHPAIEIKAVVNELVKETGKELVKCF
jgi:hypothetical protein